MSSLQGDAVNYTVIERPDFISGNQEMNGIDEGEIEQSQRQHISKNPLRERFAVSQSQYPQHDKASREMQIDTETGRIEKCEPLGGELWNDSPGEQGEIQPYQGQLEKRPAQTDEVTGGRASGRHRDKHNQITCWGHHKFQLVCEP